LKRHKKLKQKKYRKFPHLSREKCVHAVDINHFRISTTGIKGEKFFTNFPTKNCSVARKLFKNRIGKKKWLFRGLFENGGLWEIKLKYIIKNHHS
jgi:hypothetical protein